LKGVRKIGLNKNTIRNVFEERAFEYWNNDPTSTQITQEQNNLSITWELIKSGMLDNGYTPLANNADVRIAVDRIADLVSSMTIHLMENTELGDRRVTNGLSRKIDIEPCRHMTRKTWVHRIVTDLLLYGDGNSILEVETDKEGLIENLRPMHMEEVSYEIVKKHDYLIHYDGKKFKPDEVVHFTLNPDRYYPWKGTGFKVALRNIVNNLEQANKTKNAFMSGQYMPNLVVKVDALNDALSSEDGQNTIVNKYLKKGAGEPWVIPAEMLDIEQIKPLSLNDIAINDSVEIDKKTVAGIFGIPAFFLGVGQFDRNEYNNFINTRVMSIAQIISQTLTRDLLLSTEWYFKLNPRSLYSYALYELVEAGSSMVQMNAMRRNELRDWVGLPPDEEMEELIVLENYVPQKKLGEQKKLN